MILGSYLLCGNWYMSLHVYMSLHGIESLAKWRKDLRFKYYLNAIDKSLTVPDFGGFKKCHNTPQQGGLFVPSIRSNAFFYSFWPRTSRDFRDS